MKRPLSHASYIFLRRRGVSGFVLFDWLRGQILASLAPSKSCNVDIYLHLRGTFASVGSYVSGKKFDDVFRMEKHLLFPKLLSRHAVDFNVNNCIYHSEPLRISSHLRWVWMLNISLIIHLLIVPTVHIIYCPLCAIVIRSCSPVHLRFLFFFLWCSCEQISLQATWDKRDTEACMLGLLFVFFLLLLLCQSSI